MTFLIVGLGNIGAEYHGTRHNVGFQIVSALAEQMGVTFTSRRYGDVAKGRIKNAELLLLKPSTYMNLSGKAVRFYQQEAKLPNENILIIVDDLALPFGAIRLKTAGSPAGHNGLKSISECLGTDQYPRLRIGLGDNFSRGRQVDFVLSPFSNEEQAIIPLIDKEAIDTIKDFCLAGAARAMNWHNKKSILPKEEKTPDEKKNDESKAAPREERAELSAGIADPFRVFATKSPLHISNSEENPEDV